MNNFSALHWVIFGLIAFVLYRLFREMLPSRGEPLFCKACGHSGPGKRHTKGSIWIEIVLWICFIVPGLIYSIWRHTTRVKVCSSCGSGELVPLNSPVAIATRKQLGL